ncbi:hypothetical protein AAHA92_10867 [Salvia divinorum]|uniref:Myb/SANT-like domain-containing protein n=1 Tax=Salvia divinorum TaxID=28513 RepID=A0ABD1HLL2_SALDI
MSSNGKAKVTYEGVGDGGQSQIVKADRTRRSWSAREEEVLVLALHDLVSGGWKSDNGFRPGYLTRVAEVMKREIPHTQLKAQPHINSKITTWKRCYYSLSLILDRSGVGFNSDGDFKIECNDEQWSQIVKVDSNAKYMRNKSWPYWEDWNIIFGKDRASGVRVEDVSCADEILYGRSTSVADESQPNLTSYNLDDFFTEEQIQEGLNHEALGESETKSVKSPVSEKKNSRKRKPEEVLESILDVMTKMHEDTSDRLQTLSNRIGYDFDLSAKRVEVSKMLDGIPLLTKKHKFMACDILVKEPERLDLFTGFSLSDKYDYLMHILEEKHGI